MRSLKKIDVNQVLTRQKGVAGVLRVLLFIAVGVLAANPVFAQVDSDDDFVERTIAVTAVVHNDKTRSIAEKLQPSDFAVKENDISRSIVSVQKAGREPVILAVLVQDNLVSRVNNELSEIKGFIGRLPEGSKVMTAYISSGSLRVRQAFTSDLKKASDSLRIIPGSGAATPFSPFLQVKDAVRMFEGQTGGRRMALVISDGRDGTIGLRDASPFFSPYLDNAVFESQRMGVSVFTIYAPAAVGSRFYYRRALNAAQGSLLRLADETGGEAFFTGSDFVTFNPYFREFDEILKNQWLITYNSKGKVKGFTKIEVTTDFDIHLQYPAGYKAG